jgi:hypothetical protein
MSRPLPAGVAVRRGVIQRNDDFVPSYVSAAKPSGKLAMVHRSLPELETHATTEYVRVYLTVYSERGTTNYKDISQQADGTVVLHASGEMFLNMGDPWRAFHYVNTYSSQGAASPIIRSFALPRALYDELSGQAVGESQRGELGEYAQNVDKNKAPNQFSFPHDMAQRIKQQARANSLISYVEDENVEQLRTALPQIHGDVRSMNELRAKLGIPKRTSPLLVPMAKNKEPKANVHAARAQQLSRLFDRSFDVERLIRQGRLKQVGFDWQLSFGTEFEQVQMSWKAREALSEFQKLSEQFKITWPKDPGEWARTRNQIEQAATWSIVPSIIAENYDEAVARATNAHGVPLSPWARRQNFTVVTRDPKPSAAAAPPTSTRLSAEQQAAVAKAREHRRAAADAEEPPAIDFW